MKIRARLLLLLMYLLVAMSVSFFLFRQINQRQLSYIRSNEIENQTQLLANALEAVTQVQKFFTTDYSRWDLMVQAVANNDQAFFEQEFYGTLEIYKVDAVGVYTPQLTQLYLATGGNGIVKEIPAQVLYSLPATSDSPVSIYLPQGDSVVRYQVAIITTQDSGLANDPVRGYLVTAQYWDEQYLAKIAETIGGQVLIQRTPTIANPDDEHLAVALPLPSADNQTIYLIAVHPDLFLDAVKQINTSQEIIVGVLGIIMIAGSMILMQKWIVKPMQHIINKFQTSGLVSLPSKKVLNANEFTLLDSLVDEFLKQGSKVVKQNQRYEELTEAVTVAMDELAISRKELSEQLEATKRLSQAVEVTSDAVIMTNSQGEIMYVNPAWERLNQYSLSEVQGKNPRLLKSNRTPSIEYRHMWKCLSDGSSYVSENFVNRRKDGSEYCARVSVNPIKVKGKIAYYVGVSQDITDRKNADTLKTDFISLASHQLRTPLTSIRWLIELLLDHKTPAGQKHELLTEVQASAMKMIAMVSALLNISRLESGRMTIVAEQTDLNKVLRRLIKDLKPFSAIHQVELVLHEDELPQITADPLLLRELFYNLIHNAVQYSPADAKVLVTSYRQDHDVLIEVRDNGIGIPLAEQDRIFEKFYRSSNAIKFQSEGTGLGLYLARLIVDTFGGTLTFQSTPGVGTTFSITLPIKGQKSKAGEVTLTSLITSLPKQP